MAFAQTEKADLYVVAKSGLKLREAASLTATAIQTLGFEEKVKWISTDYKKPFTVEGITGYMAKVSYKGKIGYMFDGFLAVNTATNALEIKEKTVVIRQQDEMELAKMVGTMQQEDLSEVASDIGYYSMIATDALEKYGVAYTTSAMRFIRFVKSDGSTETIDTYQTPEFNCFMFDGKSVKKINTVDFAVAEEGQMPDCLKFMK